MAEQLLESLSNHILTLDGLIEEQNAIRMNETENDTFAFVESMKNKNMKSKTTSDLKNFKEWMRNENLNEDRNLEDIPPRELDMYLARFFLTIRKQDKEEYEPDTLKSFQSSFQRYLAEKGYASNILKDDCFKHSRDVLMSKRKALKQKGLGNKVRRTDAFTDDEMERFKQMKLLGKGKI